MGTPIINYNELKEYCLDNGADLFGVADITKIKDNFLISKAALKKIDRAVCIGVRLSGLVLEEIKDAPTRLYFHHYRTVNTFLDQLSFKISGYIQKRGYQALPVPASQIVDWQKQSAHLSHKHIGHLAGLGWIGRNNLLVNSELGSQFRLSCILTNVPLKADQPKENTCQECYLCVKVCPAQAIKKSPQDFNHLKCFEKLKEFQKVRQIEQYICGVCVNICKGK
ncbi:MAG: 4Fe-4S binding protein [Candidatus Omnitrophota bacterium]|nr:4Fe-4S binding protein [Candidatus Omnitrophota bacterium]